MVLSEEFKIKTSRLKLQVSCLRKEMNIKPTSGLFEETSLEYTDSETFRLLIAIGILSFSMILSNSFSFESLRSHRSQFD